MLRADRPDLDDVLSKIADTGRGLHGEFIASLDHLPQTPALVALACWHGFLPMGAGVGSGLVLLKLHSRRCVLQPRDVRVSRRARKRAAQFKLSVDEAFSDVVRAIQKHTDPGHNWLSDEVASLYASVNSLPEAARKGVKFHSIELWHSDSGTLAAGEIGYSCGGIYTSCTGFALKEQFPGAGTLQLAVLGRWLHRCKFKIWDLGMGMDYKYALGGQDKARQAWIICVRQARASKAALQTPGPLQTSRNLLSCELEPLPDCNVVELPCLATLAAPPRPSRSKRRQPQHSSNCQHGAPMHQEGVDSDVAEAIRMSIKMAVQSKACKSDSEFDESIASAASRLLDLSSIARDVQVLVSRLVDGRWPCAATEIARMLQHAVTSRGYIGNNGASLIWGVAEALRALCETSQLRNCISDDEEGVRALTFCVQLAVVAEACRATHASRPIVDALQDRTSQAGILSFTLVARTLKRFGASDATALIGSDFLLWNCLAARVAPAWKDSSPPVEITCERLGLLAANRSLDSHAVARVLGAHVLKNLDAYLQAELSAEINCHALVANSPANFQLGARSFGVTFRRVISWVLPSTVAASAADSAEKILTERLVLTEDNSAAKVHSTSEVPFSKFLAGAQAALHDLGVEHGGVAFKRFPPALGLPLPQQNRRRKKCIAAHGPNTDMMPKLWHPSRRGTSASARAASAQDKRPALEDSERRQKCKTRRST